MEESVIKIESRDENSSGKLYDNVSVEFSSAQPAERAPLRDTFDNCTLIFLFAKVLEKDKFHICPWDTLKNRRQLSPQRPTGTPHCRFIELPLQTAPVSNISIIRGWLFFCEKGFLLYKVRLCLTSVSGFYTDTVEASTCSVLRRRLTAWILLKS